MNIDDLVQFQILKHKATAYGIHTDLHEQFDVPDSRQLCAKVHLSVHGRLEAVTGLLGITKRQFIEAALIQSLDAAEAAISKTDAFDRRELI